MSLYTIRHTTIRGALLIPVSRGVGWAWAFGAGTFDLALRFQSHRAAELFRVAWKMSPKYTEITRIGPGRHAIPSVSSAEARVRPVPWLVASSPLRYPGPIPSRN